MKTMRDRYYSDQAFRALVNMMVAHIQDCHYTPSEMREAAIMACIIYEEHNMRDMIFPIEPEIEEALRIIRKRVDAITPGPLQVKDPLMDAFKEV